jgi:hypothetical protein
MRSPSWWTRITVTGRPEDVRTSLVSFMNSATSCSVPASFIPDRDSGPTMTTSTSWSRITVESFSRPAPSAKLALAHGASITMTRPLIGEPAHPSSLRRSFRR